MMQTRPKQRPLALVQYGLTVPADAPSYIPRTDHRTLVDLGVQPGEIGAAHADYLRVRLVTNNPGVLPFGEREEREDTRMGTDVDHRPRRRREPRAFVVPVHLGQIPERRTRQRNGVDHCTHVTR